MAMAVIARMPRATGAGGGQSFTPAGGLDGYTTGLGVMEASSDEFYHDADHREVEKEGMPVEMRKMIASAESFHRNTLANPEAQACVTARYAVVCLHAELAFL